MGTEFILLAIGVVSAWVYWRYAARKEEISSHVPADLSAVGSTGSSPRTVNFAWKPAEPGIVSKLPAGVKQPLELLDQRQCLEVSALLTVIAGVFAVLSLIHVSIIGAYSELGLIGPFIGYWIIVGILMLIANFFTRLGVSRVSRRRRFNPAPGWPTPPADWEPGLGWAPDAAWPRVPFGWKLWVDAE